jgi:hypothetical protein
MKIMTGKIFVLMLLITISVQPVSGQGFDAVSMGMGGAYGAVARGVNAIPWNPANLALPRTGWLEINVIGLNLNIANSTMTIDNYERYLTTAGHNGEWTDQDKKDILDLIPDDGFDANGELNANALGVAFGPFGVSAQFIGQAQGIVPKAPFELMLQGNISTNYTFDDLDADGFSAVKISFSAAHAIKWKRYFDVFAVGANLSYYSALGYGEVTESRGGLYTGVEYVAADVYLSQRTADRGSGFGMDIGAAGVINKKLSLSLSLQNILGSFSWNDGTQQHVQTFLIDSAKYVDDFEIDPVQTDTSFDIDGFTTRLPVVFHMGAAYQLRKNVTVALDVEQAFSSGMGYSNQAKISVGTEYRPIEVIPLRAGFTYGGKWGFALGLGFGFHMKALHFDFAYNMHRALWPGYAKGMSGAVNIKIAI